MAQKQQKIEQKQSDNIADDTDENDYKDEIKENNTTFDIDDATQETIVNKNDLRAESVTGSKYSVRGTATVYKTSNGYAYVLTAAHNIRHTEYWYCTSCKKTNTTRICNHCKNKDNSTAHILKAGKMYFERKNLKGDHERKYNCDDCVYIKDNDYAKHPFPPSGFDSAILKFKDDGYYQNICQNIMLINGCKFYNAMLNSKNSYYIFGYPAYVKGESIVRENMWG
eukprot:240473_1